MRPLVRPVLALCIALAASWGRPAAAYSFMTTPDGRALRWTGDNPWSDAPYVPLVGYELNATGVFADDLHWAVVRGMQRWQAASGGAFTFDYSQGDDPAVYRPVLARDGVSSIHFL